MGCGVSLAVVANFVCGVRRALFGLTSEFVAGVAIHPMDCDDVGVVVYKRHSKGSLSPWSVHGIVRLDSALKGTRFQRGFSFRRNVGYSAPVRRHPDRPVRTAGRVAVSGEHHESRLDEARRGLRFPPPFRRDPYISQVVSVLRTVGLTTVAAGTPWVPEGGNPKGVPLRLAL